MINYDHTNYILKYYNEIKNKKIVVGKKIEIIYKRLAADVKNKKGKYKFDIDRASRSVSFLLSRFVNNLRAKRENL